MDLQQTRPTARWADDGNRVIDWPEISLRRGLARTRRRARLRSRAVAALARGLRGDRRRRAPPRRARRGTRWPGMPALVSHRRAGPGPGDARRTARSRRSSRRCGCAYGGPTGLQTIVQRALGDADIPCAGLWAQVPQYVVGLAVAARGARACCGGSPRSAGSRSTCGRSTRVATRTSRVSTRACRPDPTCAEVVDRIDQEQSGHRPTISSPRSSGFCVNTVTRADATADDRLAIIGAAYQYRRGVSHRSLPPLSCDIARPR